MSTFNRFCAKVRNAALKVTGKVEEIGDSAAASVRAKNLEIRIDEQYENLGRIVYRDLHTEEDLEEKKLEIIAAIDALFDELEQIKAAKAAKKAKAEEADEAEESAEAEEAAEAPAEEAPAAETEEKPEAPAAE
jgi:hypothetical protein